MRIEVLYKKIKSINKVYKYKLELRETGYSYYPYVLEKRTKNGILLISKYFEEAKEVYNYLEGVMSVLNVL